jgi:predicted CXXCH cytochrome family protein
MKTTLTVFAMTIVMGLLFPASLQKVIANDKMLIKPKAEFCYLCHGDMKKIFMENGHGAFDLTCDMCHDVHGTGIDKMLIKQPNDLCYSCHADKKEHFESSGHAKADLTCIMCHNPHGTPPETPAAPDPKKK